MKKTLVFLFCASVILFFQNGKALAQGYANKPVWATNSPFKTDVFVENLGQFNSWAKTPAPTKYAINNSDKIFFSSQGLTFRLDKKVILSEEEMEKIESNTDKESIPKREIYFINMQWENCNPDVVIDASGETENYYTFGEKGYENVKAKGYKKLTYKNLYDGIDVEYIIPDASTSCPTGRRALSMTGGIKYSIILHPGADLSLVKMKYTGDVEGIEKDSEGNILIKTPEGNIIDRKQETGNRKPL
jgi:hypothetical protein